MTIFFATDDLRKLSAFLNADGSVVEEQSSKRSRCVPRHASVSYAGHVGFESKMKILQLKMKILQ